MINEVKRLIEAETLRTREWQEKHDTEANLFRDRTDKRLEAVEDYFRGISWGWKILLSLAALAGSVIKIWSWAKDHLK